MCMLKVVKEMILIERDHRQIKISYLCVVFNYDMLGSVSTMCVLAALTCYKGSALA